jgi:hypothetical protein
MKTAIRTRFMYFDIRRQAWAAPVASDLRLGFGNVAADL